MVIGDTPKNALKAGFEIIVSKMYYHVDLVYMKSKTLFQLQMFDF